MEFITRWCGFVKFVQPIRDPEVVEAFRDYLRETNTRNYIFFCLGVYSGLRVSDLIPRQAGEVRGSHVTLIEEKTGKPKRFIIHPEIRAELDAYIADMKDTDYLFPSRQKKRNGLRNRPISRSQAYKMLNKVAAKFGIEEIGCHTLRKTFGYHLYTSDPDHAAENLALLMRMFNHSSPTVTLRYLGLTQDIMDAATLRLSYSKLSKNRTRYVQSGKKPLLV